MKKIRKKEKKMNNSIERENGNEIFQSGPKRISLDMGLAGQIDLSTMTSVRNSINRKLNSQTFKYFYIGMIVLNVILIIWVHTKKIQQL